jgi:hypothetical protein
MRNMGVEKHIPHMTFTQSISMSLQCLRYSLNVLEAHLGCLLSMLH